MGNLQCFLTALCRCWNDLLSSSALHVSFHFLFCLSSGKLNREHFKVTFPWACVLSMTLSMVSLLDFYRRKANCDWLKYKKKEKTRYFFPRSPHRLEELSSLFLIEEINSWREQDHNGVTVQYCLWFFCLQRTWSWAPGTPTSPVGVRVPKPVKGWQVAPSWWAVTPSAQQHRYVSLTLVQGPQSDISTCLQQRTGFKWW